jgi:hypothetical protein
MKLEIFYSAGTDFNIFFDNQTVSVKSGTGSHVFDYQPNYDKIYSIRINCDNTKIMSHPVEITMIIFDEFWRVTGNKLGIGKNIYHSNFVNYANINSIKVDYSVTDNHILFFMGDLIFEFFHPIRDFIHAI